MVDSAKSYVTDKLDNLSLNADDNGELEQPSKDNASILDKAKLQLDKMSHAIGGDKSGAAEDKKDSKKQ